MAVKGREQGSIAVTMATKPNQNVTGAASNGRQSGMIITKSATLSTGLYLPNSVRLLQLQSRIVEHKGEVEESGIERGKGRE
jgi:hypothetical protein